MWISRIELTNFKSYVYQKFQLPKPADGRNLVLIGGMNGFGKTTLLEAVYLCFYGSEATTHLARAGLFGSDTDKSVSYGKFLKKALHGKALSLNRSSMEVTIAFSVDDHDGYEITRSWYYDSSGSYHDEDFKVYPVLRGIRGVPKPKEEWIEILDDHVVPAHLAPFFFFDGEEVKKLEDQDRKEWIKQGMESLLGVVLLRDLRTRLEQYQNNKTSSGKSSMDEEKLWALHQELTERERQLEELRKALIQHAELRDAAQNQRNMIHQRLSAIGAGGGGIKQVESLVREEGEKREALRRAEEAMERLLSEKLPFHLVEHRLLEALKTQLQGEAALIDWENKKQSVAPQKERFVTAFLSTEFTRLLEEDTRERLRASIDFAWHGLFNPQPDGCAKECIHEYLEPRQRQRLHEQFGRISVGYRQIKTLLQERDGLEESIRELERDRIRLEALHDDGTLLQLQEELKAVQNELDRSNLALGDISRHITDLEKTVRDDRATYEREHEKWLEVTPIKSNLRKAERVIDLIKELLPKLFSLKTRELSESVTTIFKQLAHKQQVDRIEIDEKGSSRLLSREGYEISLDRSAGENQIFATALIAGLAMTSGFNVSMLVDTPLGRLDSEHRKRILEYWLSDPKRQVILLSQDEEIDAEVFSRLRAHVAKTYLLKHEQIGDGVGKTVAMEDRYFGDVV